MGKRTLVFILGLMAVGSAVWAQLTQTVSLAQRTHDVFELTATNAVHTYSFSVGQAARLVIDVASGTAGVTVDVADPLGPLDPAGFDRFSVAEADEPALGAVLFEAGEHVQVVVDAPRAGTWTVSLALPPGAASALGSITTVATGGLGVAAAASRPYYQAGEAVVLTLLAFDGATPVVGATAAGGIYQVGSELWPEAISLLDDGVAPDSAAGDGLYTAAIEGLPAGDYLAELTLTAGAVSTTAAAEFQVLPAIGYFDGSFIDTGVDTNSDGLFD